MQTELEVKKRDKYYNSLPQRLENGTLVFPGFETKFYPNLTPAEMFHLGSFGGTYWRPIYSQVTNINYDKMWLELPQVRFIKVVPEFCYLVFFFSILNQNSIV